MYLHFAHEGPMTTTQLALVTHFEYFDKETGCWLTDHTWIRNGNMLKAEMGGQFQTCRALDTLCLHCCDLLLGVVLESEVLLKFKQN